MNRGTGEKRGVIAVLIVLFIALTALSVGVISGAKQKDELLLQYDLEKLTGLLIEDFAQYRSAPLDSIPERVLGFGIYADISQPIIRYGAAPESITELPNRESDAASIRRDKRSHTITMIRRIGIAPDHGVGPRPFEMMRRRELGFAVFLRMDTTKYDASQILYSIAFGVVPVVIAALLSAIGYFFVRSRELRRASEKQMQLARLGETARTLAHEIKNPLNAINIRARIVARSEAGDLSQEGRAIEREVGRMRMLVDRIGDFLRDPEGSPENIDLESFIREVLETNGWNVSLSFPDNERANRTIVHFDRERFRSVVTNLLMNAYEAVASKEDTDESKDGNDRPGDTDGDVSVRVEVAKKQIVLSILDRGPGMSTEQQSRAFDAFYTSKTQGSGIGLSISERFVRAAGGEIRIRQRKGGGTEMAVFLPKVES